MRYSRIDRTFDWVGFKFSATLGVLLLLFGAALHYGTLYATPLISPPPEAAVTVPQQQPSLLSTLFSSTTPRRVINTLTITDTIPQEGKFIAVDLSRMELYLYEQGERIAEYPLLTKGRPGTPWETPSGFYQVGTKEREHFSSIGQVYMPYSMQFYGNYFIHGETYYPDGTPTSSSFSGGCIRLKTVDVEKVYAFADIGTKVFVYDSNQVSALPSLPLASVPKPYLGASAYLVADIDTGDVYTEQRAKEQWPIASITKLMTALVANETITFDRRITVPEGGLEHPPEPTNTTPVTFAAEDLLYPLLMQSSSEVAEAIASYYGTGGFVQWMNTTARAFGMTSTTYADPSGESAGNVSTAEDLFRLAVYLTKKKSFVLNITHTAEKTIYADNGSAYEITNVNAPATTEPFAGGKTGHTNAARDTMLSVLSFNVGGETRRVAVVVLGSADQAKDTTELAQWITSATQAGSAKVDVACVSCAVPEYRKIEF